MCCGPETLLWFALSVFRIADMIGIDGHVSFLPPKRKKKKKKTARERREQTVIAQLGTAGQPGHITLDTYASTQQAGQALEGYFSASSAEGLFAPPDTSPQAQQQLLMALDLHLTPQQRQQGEGTAGDGSISLEELTQTLQGMPRGKSPGFDGLPYEFYQRCWDQLGPELTAVLSEALQPGAASLPADMTEGRVTLLYKGKGADRAQPASYRPITLLNTDYKLAARVIASRLGPLLNHVVDSTQTGFLPQRWIGDNILAHLETIDFHQHSQQPGVLLFLDFEKAFDRLDRPWMERCMAAVGFGAGAQRWVSLLHAGTTARVAFNGWHTARFPVQSGVFQGSPLSPLLFFFSLFFCGRKLTCPSMPILSATRKTDKANHRRVAGPQHIL